MSLEVASPSLGETHEVFNQPPPLEGYDPLALDVPLQEALARAGCGWAATQVGELSQQVGSAEMIELGRRANRSGPELRVFDRYGHRIDEVYLDDAFHQLMTIGRRAGIPSRAREGPGSPTCYGATSGSARCQCRTRS